MSARHKRSLSDWLQRSVTDAVENAVRNAASSRHSALLFQMLAGYQVEKTVNAALEDGEFNLATLVAQIGGGADFQADVEGQVVKWKDQIIDVHVDQSYCKIYALPAGAVDVVPASNSKYPAEKRKDALVADLLDQK